MIRQFTTSLANWNKNTFSQFHCTEYDSTIPKPCYKLAGMLFHASDRFWWLLAFAGLQPHHSNFSLYIRAVVSSVCVKPPTGSFIYIYLWFHLRTHLDKPDYLSTSKFLILITCTRIPSENKIPFASSRNWNNIFGEESTVLPMMIRL